MITPGLDARLRRRGRRSGFAVGATMALCVAILIGGFAVIYAKLDPILSDFVGAGEQTSPAQSAQTGDLTPTGASGAAQPTPSPRPTRAPTRTPTAAVFTPTHLSNTDAEVKLRTEPSLDSDPPVTILEPATPLQFTGETATDDDGTLWIKVKTEDNQVGWVREISTLEVTPTP